MKIVNIQATYFPDYTFTLSPFGGMGWLSSESAYVQYNDGSVEKLGVWGVGVHEEELRQQLRFPS